MSEEKGFSKTTINWFPGHMAKTRRMIKENLSLVDVVVEICDARIPYSSRNPEMDSLTNTKPRVLLLNKADLADEQITTRWIRHFSQKGITALAIDCKSGRQLQKVLPAAAEAAKEVLTKRKEKGMNTSVLRMMVVGIPNVGKSTLINRLAGSKRAKTEDRPGVTRGKQWVHLQDGSELLDMPGVLWPKFEDQCVGRNLALTGAIKDQILDIEELAMSLLELLSLHAKEALCARYKLDPETDFEGDSYDLLEKVGRKRGMLQAGGSVNTERAAIMLLDEFRGSKLGAISLEAPEDRETL